MNAGGRFGTGSDSNIRISPSEELRQLEYSQRLRDVSRVTLSAKASPAAGRFTTRRWRVVRRLSAGSRAASHPANGQT